MNIKDALNNLESYVKFTSKSIVGLIIIEAVLIAGIALLTPRLDQTIYVVIYSFVILLNILILFFKGRYLYLFPNSSVSELRAGIEIEKKDLLLRRQSYINNIIADMINYVNQLSCLPGEAQLPNEEKLFIKNLREFMNEFCTKIDIITDQNKYTHYTVGINIEDMFFWENGKWEVTFDNQNIILRDDLKLYQIIPTNGFSENCVGACFDIKTSLQGSRNHGKSDKRNFNHNAKGYTIISVPIPDCYGDSIGNLFVIYEQTLQVPDDTAEQLYIFSSLLRTFKKNFDGCIGTIDIEEN